MSESYGIKVSKYNHDVLTTIPKNLSFVSTTSSTSVNSVWSFFSDNPVPVGTNSFETYISHGLSFTPQCYIVTGNFGSVLPVEYFDYDLACYVTATRIYMKQTYKSGYYPAWDWYPTNFTIIILNDKIK